MKSYSDILAELQARKDRSAWNKGVTAYAINLLDQYQERAEYEGREAASPPGRWHKPNGSRCTSPQNRLHPPPVVPARFAAF